MSLFDCSLAGKISVAEGLGEVPKSRAGTQSDDPSVVMTDVFLGLGLLVAAVVVLFMVWSRWRRQTGGGFGPTEMSDGSMTTTPTGYPEEMKGKGKKISPTDNNAADM